MLCQRPGTVMVRALSSSTSHHAPASQATPTALVYCGPGAGVRSTLSAMQSLKEALVESVRVERLTPEQLLSNSWQEDCLVLVMPGGADLPYTRLLNGAGNRIIRDYVEKGGAYLGLCAGAYYACARVEFEPGTSLEVVGDRELAFFPGIARGSIYKGFCYESEEGAAAVPLRFRDLTAAAAAGAAAAGLPALVPAAEPALVGARAAVTAAAGAAAFSVVSGAGAARTGGLTTGRGSSSSGARKGSSRSSSSSGGESSGGWMRCVDYINGGPGFASLDGSSLLEQPPANVQVLATYPERDNGAAALLCTVGQGRAVLCGTHPELHPSWLEPCLREGGDAAVCSDRAARNESSRGAVPEVAAAVGLAAVRGPGEAGCAPRVLQSAQHAQQGQAPACMVDIRQGGAGLQITYGSKGRGVEGSPLQQLHARLVKGQAERWRYWRTLLLAAGLSRWLRPDPS